MSIEKMLCLFAHPDDETILAGGTLVMLHGRGVQTHVASATRGEGGAAGEPPVVSDRSHLGAARELELRCAAEQLGLTSLIFLDYIDPDIGPEDALSPFEADYEALVGQLGQLIVALQADVVLTHGPDGEYGHPAHRLMYRATRQAVLDYAPEVLFYSTAATVPNSDEDRLWNQSRLAHFVLDITPWAEAKVAAMECYVSQHALFKRRRKLKTVREALRPLESFYREWPESGDDLPADPFAALLRAAGAQAIDRAVSA
jgi:LmbE family N-acetylglucosaminyl deacetylase